LSDDAYWLKVYHLASLFTIEELNAAIERQKKQDDEYYDDKEDQQII
jgi:hypothetical protein